MTDATANATVRTLTAEVRTLVVGSRQVTMSVYNQLDPVEYYSIEPFGRVRTKDWSWRQIDVVGRSTRSADAGALVRSSVASGKAILRLEADRAVFPLLDIKWRELNNDGREEMARISDDWTDLPLIVLAGLR